MLGGTFPGQQQLGTVVNDASTETVLCTTSSNTEHVSAVFPLLSRLAAKADSRKPARYGIGTADFPHNALVMRDTCHSCLVSHLAYPFSPKLYRPHLYQASRFPAPRTRTP